MAVKKTKKFKVHMMYNKAGKAVKANTFKKHLELKKKGYNIIRFWESELENYREKCIQKLCEFL